MALDCSCGVVAVGRWDPCGQAFCVSHQGGPATCRSCEAKIRSCYVCGGAGTRVCHHCDRWLCWKHVQIEDRWNDDPSQPGSSFCEQCQEFSWTYQQVFNRPSERALRIVSKLHALGLPGIQSFSYDSVPIQSSGRFLRKPAVAVSVDFRGYALGVIPVKVVSADGTTDHIRANVVYSVTTSRYVAADQPDLPMQVDDAEDLVHAWERILRRQQG